MVNQKHIVNKQDIKEQQNITNITNKGLIMKNKQPDEFSSTEWLDYFREKYPKVTRE